MENEEIKKKIIVMIEEIQDSNTIETLYYIVQQLTK